MAIAALAAADQLPVSCGAVGAKSYTPPSVTIPAVTLNRGTVITVTNATIAVNGDTSSVNALMANPGSDGISLYEAILATNSNPGTWNIQFAPALKGSTIVFDPLGGPGGMPPLTGGNVTINGDIDGSGKPGITLSRAPGTNTTFFTILSGGNTLNALALQNCALCILIQRPSAKFTLPPATNTTFSNITLSNLVITGVENEGITLNSRLGEQGTAPPNPGLLTDNTWDHILITGNTISATSSGHVVGIDLVLGNTVGDVLQHTTIANNNLVIQSPGGGGIQVIAGAGLGTTNNQVLDTLIANNTITGTLLESGIHVGTGIGSASKNTMNGMQIIGNQLHMTGPGPYPAEPVGIEIVGGDAASDDVDGDPSLTPIQYSENNLISNLGILANTIEVTENASAALGIDAFGISVQESCCGNRNNTLTGLSILGNTITGNLNVGVNLNSGSSGGYYSRTTTADVLSNVLVQANTIRMTSSVYNGCNCYNGSLGITFGGIQVWTGQEEPGNTVNGLSILNNEVDTSFVGISIIAGLGQSGAPGAPISPADNNVVSAANISCNQLDQAATIALAPYTGVKGINVVAGLLNASGNQVQQLSIGNNLVGGVLNDVSFFTYLGAGASGNSISLANPSGTVNGPQTKGGLVNAATFQQNALVPGSLVTLFGLDLNGATVQVGGIPAPILYASSSQLNLQVPWELQVMPIVPVTVTVTGNSISSELESVAVGQNDPGIFSLGAPQGGQGAIENVAGAVVDSNSPAHAGDYVLIFATGLGMVTNQPATGAVALAAPHLSYLISYPSATIGGVQAPVSFAGLAPGYVGLYQVNVQVPQGVAAGDSVPVVLSFGATVSNSVTISVR
ncbi:MAG TPA: hypothetical protein VMH05_13075 [Bryobacteraceae bacterium]|nr:hypothetical protein [Bryobacteraceae bacterium]